MARITNLLAFVAGMVFLVGFSLVVWQASQHSKPNNYSGPTKYEDGNKESGQAIIQNAPDDHHKSSKQKDKWYQTFVDHPTEWLLVLFNLILATYTARLYYATAALAGADRPNLLPIDFRITGLKNTPDGAGLIKCDFRFKFQNFGRSPAFVKKYSVDVWVCDSPEDELPTSPHYKTPIKTRHIIAPITGWYGTTNPSHVFMESGKAEALLKGIGKCVAYGFIEYGNVGRESYEIKFAFQFDFDEAGNSLRYYPAGSDKYWRYT